MYGDNRHFKFIDSLLGCIETSQCEGLVYFNCVPNIIVHIHDLNVRNSIIVNVKTHGFNMELETSNITLVYRNFFKAMNRIASSLKVKSLREDARFSPVILSNTPIQYLESPFC